MPVGFRNYLRMESYSDPSLVARGFMRSGQGNPDEARAARFILKDYVNGKLLYCHAPPTASEDLFNEETHARQLLRVAGKKRAPTTRVGKDADTYIAPAPANADGTQAAFGNKALAVDDDFFQRQGLSARPFVAGSNKKAMTISRPTFYPNQVLVADDGTPLTGQQVRLEAMMRNVDLGGGKKHHKKMKRVKQRSGKGYD